MILIEFLFALTVPSAPSPQNNARTWFSGSVLKSGSYGRLVCVTSSLIPIVKWFLGFSFFNSSNTPLHIAGVNSFDDRPYRPPTTRGMLNESVR